MSQACDTTPLLVRHPASSVVGDHIGQAERTEVMNMPRGIGRPSLAAAMSVLLLVVGCGAEITDRDARTQTSTQEEDPAGG